MKKILGIICLLALLPVCYGYGRVYGHAIGETIQLPTHEWKGSSQYNYTEAYCNYKINGEENMMVPMGDSNLCPPYQAYHRLMNETTKYGAYIVVFDWENVSTTNRIKAVYTTWSKWEFIAEGELQPNKYEEYVNRRFNHVFCGIYGWFC